MKTNKSLFDKKIELKNCQINGGRASTTNRTSTSSTGGGGDISSTVTYEDGSWQTLTHYY